MSKAPISDTSLRPYRMTPPPGVDEAAIERLVRAFYGRIRHDEVIGPIFQGVIGEDWEPHLSKMCDFWSSIALTSGRYKGMPLPVHKALPGLRPEHFDHWLAIFSATAHEICQPEAAAFFIGRAERIADSFRLGIFFKIEDLLPPVS